MHWLDVVLDRLARQPVCGYTPQQHPRVEPSAFAALALLLCDRASEALPALRWLEAAQRSDGGFGLDEQTPEPCWPTSAAALTLVVAGNTLADTQAAATGRRAVAWLLRLQGEIVRCDDPTMLGHDTSLRGWPWVGSTHSWVEPTAMALLALRAAGECEHPRAREAVRLLINRALPGGGWNYGNTTVLGHVLRAHLEPSGLALAALAAEPTADDARRAGIGFLRRTLRQDTASSSLAYAAIGLTLNDARERAIDDGLALAAERTMRHEASPYRLALLAIASSAAGARLRNVLPAAALHATPA